jgi:pimeloyl-ACP methyl ester carboxylesterase
MNSARRYSRSGFKLFFAAAIVWTIGNATAADGYVPFSGEKTAWHEGFDRYDFMMDDATGAITPMTAPASEVTSFGIDVVLKGGKRRCVVVVPKKAAPGNPWSWRGCYWNHQPQTEVELLRRGFHIAFVAPDPAGQGKAWDLWYKFMTETHGLAKKSAFIGMSKGGVNEFNWGGANPDKVACMYADNPAVYDYDYVKIPVLAQHDIPLLHVVGTEDFVLRNTLAVEQIYHQWGGSITVIMKEGVAHHPHSLEDPTPIADWIERHMQPADVNRPAFADSTYTKTHYYSLDSSYIYLKKENTYATVRGPGYVPSYDRYTSPGTGSFHADAMSIVVPEKPAPGKLWVFHPSFLERDSTVALALLAKGYYIVLPPISGSGAVQTKWDEVYKLMVDNGFAKKVVMEGTGAKAGESYAWAIANPDRVSVIYARNPLMRSLMSNMPPPGSPAPPDPYLPSPSKMQPIDNLAPLAKAGVPILHDCGSLDPWLKDQTRVAEKRYKELGGKITVLVTEGEGHFPVSRKDPKPVVDFILSNQR